MAPGHFYFGTSLRTVAYSCSFPVVFFFVVVVVCLFFLRAGKDHSWEKEKEVNLSKMRTVLLAS